MECSVKFLFAVILVILAEASLGALISQKHFAQSPVLLPPPESSLDCPCSQDLLCMPLAQAKEKSPSTPHVQEYVKKSAKKEVFAFVLKCDSSVWSKFDWTKLTTIAIAGFYDPHLVCFAHQHGVKVVKLGNFPTSKLPNATARANWVDMQASDTALKFLDGINIDYEMPFNQTSRAKRPQALSRDCKCPRLHARSHVLVIFVWIYGGPGRRRPLRHLRAVDELLKLAGSAGDAHPQHPGRIDAIAALMGNKVLFVLEYSISARV
ncbi:uncharacterized protein LOC119578555 [Penaeus monodon]|uniref:uncharacterized protein LOC119578555 n=1 Tax=Penaeus monodon TaxID=6687 RepID=UPI0018A756EF|nr:uncharacterized protein LOC119578555 [Penaeus monodon]